MATGAIIAGSLVTAGVAAHSAHQQRKAARSAARAAEKAARTPVTVSSGNDAAETTSTEATAGKNVANQAKRRLTVEDTVQRFSGVGLRQRFSEAGLRKTLN